MSLEHHNAVMRGGPVDGLTMEAHSGSVICETAERPGEIARYRRTRQKEGVLTVYTFREWDRIVGKVAEVSRG